MLHGMETRPIQPSNRCNATSLAIGSSLCIPTIQSDKQGLTQGLPGPVPTHDNNNTSLAFTTMVSSTSGNVYSKSYSLTKIPQEKLTL